MARKQKYESDIELGVRYRDPQTGIEGVATSVAFYQHACERTVLEYVDGDGAIVEHAFDAPRLERADQPGQRARSSRPGGPGRVPARPGMPTR